MLKFKLFGIPVRVQLMFGITALILWQLSGQQSAETLGVWTLVMFLGVLFHELGHALAGVAFGLRPNIDLHGMGGVTWWTGGRALTPGRSIVVSAAGPAVGIILGGVAMAYMAFDPPAGHSLWGYALASFVWVNLGWGIFNLVPMLPLDGGNILASVCQLFSPKGGRRIAAYVSLAVAGVLILISISYGQYIMAGFFAFFSWGTLQGLKRQKDRAVEEPFRPKLAAAIEALQRREFKRAELLASELGAEAPTPEIKAAAGQVLAWARFSVGDVEGAQRAIDERPKGAPVDPGLQGSIHLSQGEPELALRHLEGAMQLTDDPKITELLCAALLQAGRGAEVIALLESGAGARMPAGAVERLGLVAEKLGDADLTRKISGYGAGGA